MHSLVMGLGPTELLIILAIILLLFGGSRLAGLGKSTGRAIREFKEETKDVKGDKGAAAVDGPATPLNPSTPPAVADEVHDAEIVDPERKKDL